MTITQTVDIPADRRLIIDVPREVPTGRASVVIQFPVRDDAQPAVEPKASETPASTDEALVSARGILTKHLPAFEALAK